MRLLLGILLISLLWAKENYPWTLQPCYEVRARWLVPVDIENDGVSEIIECVGPYAYVKDQNGVIKAQITFDTDNFIPVGAYNLNNKFFNEVIFFVNYVDSVYLCTINENGKKRLFRACHGKDIKKAGPSGYDSAIRYATAADLNGNGFQDLICNVNTGFDLYPRGILVYNYKDNKELWHYWVGCAPAYQQASIFDINNDAKTEIIFGTAATCNGAYLNGVDDFHSWVIVLDSKGELLWKNTIGDASTVAYIWVGDLYKTKEIVVVVCETDGLSDRKEPNRILILDAQSGEVKKYIATGERFFGMKVCDYNRDDDLEIITSNSDGILRIFDKNLDLMNQRSFEVGITLSVVEDIDGNGTQEILLTTKDGRIIILDEKLDILCDYKTPQWPITECVLARNGNKYNIIASCLSGSERNYTILKVENAALLPVIPTNLFLSIGIILLAVGLIYAVWNRVKFAKRVRKMLDESPFAFMLLDHNNALKYYNYNIKKIIGETETDILKFLELQKIKEWLKKPEKYSEVEITYNNKATQKHLKINFQQINNEKILIIFDRTQEVASTEIISWSGFAQRLAHEIKNPLSTMNLTLQRLQEIAKKKFGKEAKILDNYTNSVLEEIERLRNTTDKFMRILSLEKSKLELNDVNIILGKTSAKYEAILPKGIKIKKYFAKDLPLIRCDENKIIAVFLNVIENSLEAIESKGTLSLHTSLIEKIEKDETLKGEIQNSGYTDKKRAQIAQIKKFIEVRIEDTGKGIAKDNLKNLFKPFHSTKPSGTGLGLVIAKRIVEQHRGEIHVESKENIGTVMTITLPVAAK